MQPAAAPIRGTHQCYQKILLVPPLCTKRSGENEILISSIKKQILLSLTEMKRGPEILAEAFDPRVTDTGGEGDDGPEGGVLQVLIWTR